MTVRLRESGLVMQLLPYAVICLLGQFLSSILFLTSHLLASNIQIYRAGFIVMKHLRAREAWQRLRQLVSRPLRPIKDVAVRLLVSQPKTDKAPAPDTTSLKSEVTSNPDGPLPSDSAAVVTPANDVAPVPKDQGPDQPTPAPVGSQDRNSQNGSEPEPEPELDEPSPNEPSPRVEEAGDGSHQTLELQSVTSETEAEQDDEPIVLPPILNDRLAELTTASSSCSMPLQEFTCFQQLPCELRLKIWNYALRRQRFIRIYGNWGSFKSPSLQAGSRHFEDAYKSENALGKIISGQLYMVHPGIRDGWDSRRFPSSLMAVNAEARQAALEFYYLQIPAADREKYGEGKPTIYLNPIWDQIRFFTRAPTDLLDFLWDVRAYDPRGVGLTNWVISPYNLRQLAKHNFEVLEDWPMPSKSAIGELLQSPKNVMFTHRDLDKSRLRLYSPTNMDRINDRDPLQPIFARPQEFELLEEDPRPGVSVALTTIWLRDNPREAVQDFGFLLRYFGAKPDAITFTHMVCLRPEWKRYRDGFSADWVCDREDLQDLLRVDAVREAKERKEALKAERLLGGAGVGISTPLQAPSVDENIAQMQPGGAQDGQQPVLQGESQPNVQGEDRDESQHAMLTEGQGGAGNGEPAAGPAEEQQFDAQQAAVQPDIQADNAQGAGAAVNGSRSHTYNKLLGLPPVDIPEPPPVERVAGFWVFPSEAFGDLKELRSDMSRWNLSAWRPQLGVFRLPDKAKVR